MEENIEEEKGFSQKGHSTSNQKVGMSKLSEMIEEIYQNVDSKNQSIVLLWGNVGSGKSTLINYFLGSKIVKYFDEKTGKKSVKVAEGDKEHAKIGVECLSAETLYSTVYPAESDDFAYCDCPGFGDTRGIEAKICTAINNQLAIRSSKTIKALVFVLSYQEFRAEKGEGLRSILPMIKKSLKVPDTLEEKESLSASIYFMVTQTPDGIKKSNIINTIKEMIEEISTHDDGDMDFLYGLKCFLDPHLSQL